MRQAAFKKVERASEVAPRLSDSRALLRASGRFWKQGRGRLRPNRANVSCLDRDQRLTDHAIAVLAGPCPVLQEDGETPCRFVYANAA